MVFSELPAGAEFCFGGYMAMTYDGRLGRTKETYMKMKWRKTNLNGLSIQIHNTPNVSFDHPRPSSGSSRTIRSHGHRLFFLTSLYKYLNCDDMSWKDVDPGDRAPRATDSKGYLSRFNEDEIKYLQPFTMKINVPSGYNKQYGQEMERDVLVGIPSIEQMGNGSNDGMFGIAVNRVFTWLSDADTMIRTFRSDWLGRQPGDCVDSVAPIIRIKDDAPVDVDEHGVYVIRVPEVGFEGDIEAFLGLAVA